MNISIGNVHNYNDVCYSAIPLLLYIVLFPYILEDLPLALHKVYTTLGGSLYTVIQLKIFPIIALHKVYTQPLVVLSVVMFLEMYPTPASVVVE